MFIIQHITNLAEKKYTHSGEYSLILNCPRINFISIRFSDRYILEKSRGKRREPGYWEAVAVDIDTIALEFHPILLKFVPFSIVAARKHMSL